MTLLANVATESQRERYWIGLRLEFGHSPYSRKMNELDAKVDG
jgi:hypothetical protein